MGHYYLFAQGMKTLWTGPDHSLVEKFCINLITHNKTTKEVLSNTPYTSIDRPTNMTLPDAVGKTRKVYKMGH